MIDFDILAVVILYNVNKEALKNNLTQLATQVDKVVLVDNSTNKIDQSFFELLPENISTKVTYIFNNENLGVARAQNIGINIAIENNYQYVILFDQDSTPADNMITTLIADYNALNNLNIKLAAIGPTPINVQNDEAYKPRIKKNKPYFDYLPHIINVSELISSGCLIPITAIKEVGFMDEDLFIDGVDHEWCWRAAMKGLRCAQTSNAKLYHMLGEGDKRFMGVRIAITSPFRVYYQYRNFIYLCFKKYVPLYWKINNFVKYSVKLFYYPIFIKPQTTYIKNMLKGVLDGVKMIKINNNN